MSRILKRAVKVQAWNVFFKYQLYKTLDFTVIRFGLFPNETVLIIEHLLISESRYYFNFFITK